MVEFFRPREFAVDGGAANYAEQYTNLPGLVDRVHSSILSKLAPPPVKPSPGTASSSRLVPGQFFLVFLLSFSLLLLICDMRIQSQFTLDLAMIPVLTTSISSCWSWNFMIVLWILVLLLLCLFFQLNGVCLLKGRIFSLGIWESNLFWPSFLLRVADIGNLLVLSLSSVPQTKDNFSTDYSPFESISRFSMDQL